MILWSRPSNPSNSTFNHGTYTFVVAQNETFSIGKSVTPMIKGTHTHTRSHWCPLSNFTDITRDYIITNIIFKIQNCSMSKRAATPIKQLKTWTWISPEFLAAFSKVKRSSVSTACSQKVWNKCQTSKSWKILALGRLKPRALSKKLPTFFFPRHFLRAGWV